MRRYLAQQARNQLVDLAMAGKGDVVRQ
jgi:hypothetical protein